MLEQTGTLAAVAPAARACNALLIFPRFNDNSFWALEEACRMQGAKAPAPPLSLMTVAALLPQSWNFRLVNRNTEDLTEADLAWADLVLTGGMLFQSADTLHLIEMCKARDLPVCVGGPDPTSRPQTYAAADIIVCGEFESTVEDFVAVWDRGERHGRFTAEKFKADVTTTPVPRYDLIKMEDYLWINLQFSRGCPFTCEFCDIIELYGRAPRTKTTAQVLAELDRLLAMGYRGHVDFVDDNLIGNKKALKKFLPDLRRWQDEHGWPFFFSTEASLNLSDDGELMRMMREAGFFAVFVGIESGDEATLAAIQKKQNTRRSIADSVQRIYRSGMFVTAGFILGFETERPEVAAQTIATIEATGIAVCFINLLSVLPNTQLARRLKKEGKIDADFEVSTELGQWCMAGLNFETARPKSEILRDYVTVLSTVHSRDAFFGRLTRLIDILGKPLPDPAAGAAAPAVMHARKKTWRDLAALAGPLKRLLVHRTGVSGAAERKNTRRDLKTFARLLREITWRRPEFFVPTVRLVAHCLRANPTRLSDAIRNLAFYLHISRFMERVLIQAQERIVLVEAEEQALLAQPRLTAAE